MVPTDFSSYSDKAVTEALGLALEYGAEVYVLHVLEEKIGSMQHDYSDVSVSPDAILRRQKRLLRLAKNKLNKWLARLSPAVNTKMTPAVVLGVPYEEILRFQQDMGIDLIVISSLGTTGLGKYFIGGVARNVLKGSTCPVLLIKDAEGR